MSVLPPTPLSPSLVELGNVPPGCAIDDVIDTRSTYSEPRRYFFASNAVIDQLPYLTNVVVRNLGLTVARACRATPLCLHVGHVLGLSAKPEVSIIHAAAIVPIWAIMANIHAVWNRAIGHFPSQSVRPFKPATVSPSDPKYSIASEINGGCPKPTAIWRVLVNFFPELIGRGAQFSNFAVMESDEAHRLAFDAPLFGVVGYRDTCLLATAAMTVAVGDFVKRKLGLGELWGSIHMSLAPQTLLTTAGTLARRLPPFIGVLQEYFSTNRLEIQPCV